MLGKYDVKYYRCANCGFVWTEKPYWLAEAYSSAIADADIGLIGRNVENAKRVDRLLRLCFPDVQSFLDYGGGYGMFVRMMRDNGYDAEWSDVYCQNLFAKGHEKAKEHYDVLTAFELFEHFENPLETIKMLLDMCDTLIFSTETLSDPPPKVADWWYYATGEGQHIAFYAKNTLEYIADAFNRHYYKLMGLHLYTKTPLSKDSLRRVEWLKHGGIRARLVRKGMKASKRKSLLSSDYEAITGDKL